VKGTKKPITKDLNPSRGHLGCQACVVGDTVLEVYPATAPSCLQSLWLDSLNTVVPGRRCGCIQQSQELLTKRSRVAASQLSSEQVQLPNPRLLPTLTLFWVKQSIGLSFVDLEVASA